MIKIYVWGMDCITYDTTTKKWKKWSSTCTGDLTASDTKKKNYWNIQKWFNRTENTVEDAKAWMIEYRKAWVDRDHKRTMEIMGLQKQ